MKAQLELLITGKTLADLLVFLCPEQNAICDELTVLPPDSDATCFHH